MQSADGQLLPPLQIIGTPGNELPSEANKEQPTITTMHNLHAMQMMQMHMGATAVPGLPGLGGQGQAADLDPALVQATSMQLNSGPNIYMQQHQMQPFMMTSIPVTSGEKGTTSETPSVNPID